MTSASIMEMQKTGFVAQSNTVKAQASNVSMQFSDAMEFASAGQQDSSEISASAEVKAPAEKNPVQHTGRKEIRESDAAEVSEVDEAQLAEETQVKEEEIVKEIAEELGVSEEEVKNAMEVLGLGVADLLSQGNMTALVAQLTGMQPVDVLTDENLFAQVTQLTGSVQEQLQVVADELGMSLEQLQAAMDEQMLLNENQGMVQEQNPTGLDHVQAEPRQDETVSKVAETVSEEAKPIFESAVYEENVSEDVPAEENAEMKVSAADEPDVFGEKMTSVTTSHESEAGKQEQTGHGAEENSAYMQGNANLQQATNDGNVFEKVAADDLSEGRFDLEQTKELIRQISDYVRVHHSEKISSMEIQLHPVELGTVNLQVIAKDGNVSARLAVQDEAVRAAMESQVMQLRESLQEQGLKIDAVEVTVAAHEFEQNLDQHGKDAEEQAAKEKKGSRRILDLNEIGQGEEDEAEMSDADRLQIEMMRMGGNRLNFRV